MRLQNFRLLKYGPFEDFTLALDAAPGCLNIVTAPNGAGKSVLRQAFGDLLFGIGGQSPMGFRHGYAGMRLCAEAVTPDGARHAFGRRKGHGNTWTDLDGNPLATPAIAAVFARTDLAGLERLFALDTERLRRGGEALLAEDGAIGEALLSGAGMFNTRKIRDELIAQADALAPQRKAASKPFYVALDHFVAARRAAADALLRPDAWERLVREQEETEARLAAQRGRAAEAAASLARLERIRRLRAPLAAHDEAAAWLAANETAPVLPATLGPRLEDAQRRLDLARQQHQAETERYEGFQASLANLTVDEKLLAHAADIERLAEKAGAVEQALTDIPKRAAELAQLEDAVTARLRRLGADVPVAEAAVLIPRRADEAQARQLIGQHEGRVAALREAEDQLAALTRDIAAREAALARLPAPADTALLARLRDEIRASGDPAAQTEQARAACAEASAALAAALASVPFWQGQAADLAALVPLPAAAYDRAHAALSDAEASLARCAETMAAAGARRDESARTLADVQASGEIPDRASIEAARRHRDAGYGLVARLAFGGAAPSADDVAAFAGAAPLSLAYEQAVAKADRLADRQVDESELVARAAEARRTARDAAQALAAADTAHAAAAEKAAAALAAFQDLLPACLPRTARLDDIRAFLAGRQTVIERQATRDAAEQRVQRLGDTHAGWAAALAAALAAPPGPLPHLLAQATHLLEDAARTEKERTTLEAALAELRRRDSALRAAREKAAAGLAAWQSGWATTLSALGRPAGEAPSVTAEVLQLLDDLSRDLERATAIAQRLAEMRQETDAFATAMADLSARLDLTYVPETRAMLAAIRAQREKLTDQRSRDTRRRTYAQQAEQAAVTLATLARALANRQSELQDVITACGADSLDAALQRLAAAAARAAHQATLDSNHAKLMADGDGLTLAALRAEADAVAADDVPAALAAARAEAEAAQEQAQADSGALALQRQKLEQLGRDTAYAEAMEAQQAATATADRLLREALTARLAAALLGRALEAVEQAGGADMLARIGGWFALLTGGAYRALVSEPTDDKRQMLLAVPADRPEELKYVHQLSEGTRDQLYLALRLEAVAAHADPLPFIADDILQTFDDARALAALHTLQKLSETVQVIVLTHHGHIAELAARLPVGCFKISTLS